MSLKTSFEQALDFTFSNEGGFSNDKNDHGGATRFGITRDDASRWRKRPVSVQEMREFPLEEAKAIYSAWYFKPLGCDGVEDTGVAVALFDIGVVCGISTAAKLAQRICQNHGAQITQDGHIGPKSLAAINQIAPAVFLRDFSQIVESRFRSIAARNPSQNVFLKGWVNRARRLLTLIKA